MPKRAVHKKLVMSPNKQLSYRRMTSRISGRESRRASGAEFAARRLDPARTASSAGSGSTIFGSSVVVGGDYMPGRQSDIENILWMPGKKFAEAKTSSLVVARLS